MNSQVQVRNIQGQLIHEQQIQAQKSKIDLQGYPSGIYLMTVQNGIGRIVKKVVVR